MPCEALVLATLPCAEARLPASVLEALRSMGAELASTELCLQVHTVCPRGPSQKLASTNDDEINVCLHCWR